MNYNKKSQIIIALLIFVFTGFLNFTNVFYVTVSNYKEYPTDYVFMILVNILFWYSSAYLLNYIINYFFWEKIFKLSTRKISFEWSRELVSSLIYTIATAVILKNSFWINFDFFWITILILLFLVQMAVRPKVLSLFPREAFARVRPFNVGDWITIKSKNGNNLITGMVENITRGSVVIKNENNNRVFISMNILSDVLIENHTSLNEYSKFSTKICLDHSIPVKNVKRILLSTLENIYYEKNLSDAPEPQVLINNVNELGIVYELIYWLKPWKEISPDEFNDIVLNASLENLSYAGIYPAYKKNDVYIGNYQRKFYDINLIEDRKKILQNIELLKFLNEDELNSIASNILVKGFDKNEVVINEGEEGDSMFILVEGLLNVFVKNKEGIDVHVGNLKAGDFFGEMSLFTGEPRSATIKAKTKCLIFEINKDIISPVIHNRTNLVEEFGKVIAERQSINVDKISQSEIQVKSRIKIIADKIKKFFGL
ncbi:MAG: mechanosensitive ion channel family protein [Melioribacter sp.]|uniref:mechanosensitive ion channel family protein n=1 Tax=Rosettibacter primus TaxID=3111523 RepID=UPI00247D26F9|nr:mechanosensitive ion channel family protein [Melioribacter sp.]